MSVVIVLFLLVAGNAIAKRAAWVRALNIPGSFVGGAVSNLANALIIMGFYQWLVG